MAKKLIVGSDGKFYLEENGKRKNISVKDYLAISKTLSSSNSNNTNLPELTVVGTKQNKNKATKVIQNIKRRQTLEDMQTYENVAASGDITSANTIREQLDNQARIAEYNKANADYQKQKQIEYNDPRFIHNTNLVSADKEAHNRTISYDTFVEPTFNFISPSQQFGAITDKIQGKKGYFQSLADDNSGFVSDEFQKYLPGLANTINIVGDIGTGVGLAKSRDIARGLKAGIDYTKPFAKRSLQMAEDQTYGRMFNSYNRPLIGRNEYARIVSGEAAINDAIDSGLIRARTGIYHGGVDKAWDNFSEAFKKEGFNSKEDIINYVSNNEDGLEDINDIILSQMPKGLNRSDKFSWKFKNTLRNSTNHGGTVGFVKGGLFYDLKDVDRVIVGNDKSAIFARGHHGSWDNNIIGKDIPKGRATVILKDGTSKNATASASGFYYYEPYRTPSGKLKYRKRSFTNNKQ